MTLMKCTLCKDEIDNYKPDFHRLVLDEKHSADICADCADTFLKWQAKKFASLFPTAAMKKRYGKRQQAVSMQK